MKITEILYNIKKSKKYNLEEYHRFEFILTFLQHFLDDYNIVLDEYSKSNVRFCDYYEESFDTNELLDYFKNNYYEKDLNKQYNYFILYCIFKKSNFLLEAFEVLSQDEFLELYPEDVEKMCDLINEFYKLNKVSEIADLGFNDHKYKLLFSGYSHDDVLSLDKKIIKSLVNKIKNILLECDIVPGAEGIDHVRDKYNIPILRIQLADDYRISFIRRKGITIILGVELKTGKDINYTRYDYIAKKIDDIYIQSDLLNEGKLPLDNLHFEVIKYIENKMGLENKYK